LRESLLLYSSKPSLGVYQQTSNQGFSSDGPDEGIATPKLRKIPDRNSSKQNTMRKQYTDLGDSGGLYRRKLYIETKSQEETGSETSSGVFSHQGGAARGGPAPLVCEEYTDSFSCPFLSRNFSYLVKTTTK
jgi:hypothetical protein